jgi:hypothetical protein
MLYQEKFGNPGPLSCSFVASEEKKDFSIRADQKLNDDGMQQSQQCDRMFCLEKIAQRDQPILPKLKDIFSVKKLAQKLGQGTYIIYKQNGSYVVHNLPNGENSPNLVTLAGDREEIPIEK